jgi:hypothetical protein
MKILILIRDFIFGVSREPVDSISTGLYTVHPDNSPNFQNWANQFNVSMLHDKKVVFINS